MSHAPSRRLIVDVGFNTGADTASYLSQGYNVLAVEANAELLHRARQNEPFASALADGRLTLVYAAITRTAGGNVTFYVNTLHPELSSLDQQAYRLHADTRSKRDAARTQHAVHVKAETCANLLASALPDVPLYMKVDVEGADDACYASVAERHTAESGANKRLPQFVSAEEVTLPILASLVRVGYHSSKCQDRALHDPLSTGAWGDAAIDSATNSTRWRDAKAFLAERQEAARAFTPRRGAKSFHICPGADIHLRLDLGW